MLAIGGTLLFIGNARVVVNVILAGMFDRYPDLKMVSVESGCGWIPFILEALDYEMEENAPSDLAKLTKMPSEYFRSNLYATYWFEKNQASCPRSSRRSGRTASCSRPTSPIRHACTPGRSRRPRKRWLPSHPRCVKKSLDRTHGSSTGSETADA
jgi:hypothetical protein